MLCVERLAEVPVLTLPEVFAIDWEGRQIRSFASLSWKLFLKTQSRLGHARGCGQCEILAHPGGGVL